MNPTTIIDPSLLPVLAQITMTLTTDWHTIINMRLVCRAWRSCLDHLAYGHIVILPSENDDTAVRVRSLPMELPPAMALIHPDRWVVPHPGYCFTAQTSVLSIVGFTPGTCNLLLLRRAFPNLVVLRLSPDLLTMTYLPYIPYEARTLVFFSSKSRDSHSDASSSHVLTQQPTARPGMYNLVWRWTAKHKVLYPPDYPRTLSAKVERIVLHTWNLADVPDLAAAYSLPRSLSKHLREIVIVVPIYVGLELTPTFNSWNMAEAVRNLAPALDVPHVTYTIVGLEAIKVENYEAQFKDSLSEALQQRDRDRNASGREETTSEIGSRERRVSGIMSRVRTMTLVEYIAAIIDSSSVLGELMAVPPWELTWLEPGGVVKKKPWDFLEAYPHHRVVSEEDCPADRLFGYVAENGLF